MLYHFSENPSITRFVPRPAKVLPDKPPVVWAIDETHAVHYCFPRDCPRVIYTRSGRADPRDLERFFDGSAADKIIAVEAGWLERIRETRLYKYTFDDADFKLSDEIAGYYISEQEIVPLQVEPVGDLLHVIAQSGTELRLTPSLVPLRNAVIASTLDFSVIRYANAIKE